MSFVVDNKEDAASVGDIGEQDGIFNLEDQENGYARVEDAIREIKEGGLYDEGKRTELRRIRDGMHRVMQESGNVRGESQFSVRDEQERFSGAVVFQGTLKPVTEKNLLRQRF